MEPIHPSELTDAESSDERQSDLLLGPRELAVRAGVRRVVRDEVRPRARQVDAEESFAEASYQAVARDFGGLWAGPEDGGTGESSLAYAIAVEEIAAACASTSTIFMTQMHAGYPIQLAGSQPQRRRYLPPLCDGSIYGSIAITEPAAGSDAGALSTRAIRDGDSYVLNGSKTFITTGNHAGVIVLFATVDPAAGTRGITAFCVEPPLTGLIAGPPLHKLGMRGSPTAELFFADCRIPAGSRLGDEGGGWALSLQSVNKTRISASAQGVGIAAGAYLAARRWAGERGLLDRAAHHAQGVQFTLARLRARVLAARLLLYTTAMMVDEQAGEDLTSAVSMAKLVCTDTAMEVSSEAMDLLGPDGDRPDLDVERHVRDAKVLQIYDGTNQIQQLIIARDLHRLATASGRG